MGRKPKFYSTSAPFTERILREPNSQAEQELEKDQVGGWMVARPLKVLVQVQVSIRWERNIHEKTDYLVMCSRVSHYDGPSADRFAGDDNKHLWPLPLIADFRHSTVR